MFSIIQAAGWPIWPLLICSIIALAVIIERFISLQTAKIAPPQLLNEAITASRTAPQSETVKQLAANSALGEVLSSGLQARLINPKCTDEDLLANMEATGRLVAHNLEKHLAILATIASAAPLLGLFGTVVGMIEIFGAQPTGANAGNNNPAQLAHGISVALYNTAFGLMVAIPSLIFWRYFRARVDAYLLSLELASERFARHLTGQQRRN